MQIKDLKFYSVFDVRNGTSVTHIDETHHKSLPILRKIYVPYFRNHRDILLGV